MANAEHVAILKKGVDAWNAWRGENPRIRPNLGEADLFEADLKDADLSDVDLFEADLRGADLSDADLFEANLINADLSAANLRDADLSYADLRNANLSAAKLHKADLSDADLRDANLSAAKLHRADLRGAILIGTDFSDADLTGCRIYGVSAWRLKLDGAKQQNLVITRRDEPDLTVDNIEVAQFIYLMLNNEKVRDVIDTITSKAVLILGRFTDERKAVLDALREELRKRDYLPILFDFAVPATRDITETVSLLARMARFIIADLTDPMSIPKELEAIVPDLAVPVQPLLEGSSRPYAMFKDYWKYEWLLPVYRYEGLEPLLATLAEKVIAPAEGKVKALEERRRMIEAELTKPQ
jgi:Pentapeptide repeats (8 copies)